MRNPTYRIRRCGGNRACWLLVRLREDGSELRSHGGYTTSHSIDALLTSAAHLQPGPDDTVELLYSPA